MGKTKNLLDELKRTEKKGFTGQKHFELNFNKGHLSQVKEVSVEKKEIK